MKYAVLILAALALVFGAQVVVRAEAPAGVQKWEFKRVASTGESGLDEANAAGKEGWELVATQDGWLLLKRPLK